MNKYLLFLIVIINQQYSVFAQNLTESKQFQMPIQNGDNIANITWNDKGCKTLYLDVTRSVEGLSLTGNVFLPMQDSFVRVLLQDKDGKEYLILETSRLYNDTDTVCLNNYCEETKYLNDVYPRQINIYSNKATIDVSYVSLKFSNEKNSNRKTSIYEKLSKENKYKQVAQVASVINESNKRHNRLWRAEATDIALLPWEQKKRVMSMDGSCWPMGFEYYSTGIFEVGEFVTQNAKSTITVSPYVETFDWRDRHGINWMTPVKHQSTGSGCWAFAAVGVTEALVNLYFNKKIDYDLSEQEVISCSGCGTNLHGGHGYTALDWISSHGISEEVSFPFSNSDEPCENKGSFNELITMNGTSNVQNHRINNNDSVKKALIKYGPLASGYRYNNGTRHAHAMTLLG